MRVNSFFCFRLETAGLIIGWLEVVGALLCFLVLGLIFGYANHIAEEIMKQSNGKFTKDEQMLVIYWLDGFQLFFTVVQLISAAMLIVGTMGKRHRFLVPWLVNSAISISFSVISARHLFSSVGTSAFFVVLLLISLRLYVAIAMKSLYADIKEERERAALIDQPMHGYTNIKKV